MKQIVIMIVVGTAATWGGCASHRSSGSTQGLGFDSGTTYRAVCVDGHGVLCDWKSSRDEANKIGKDHEYQTKGHRWDIQEHNAASANGADAILVRAFSTGPVSSGANDPQGWGDAGGTCIRYFSLGSFVKVGIRNNCDVCKIAVIACRNSNGTEVKRVSVPANNQVDFSISGYSCTELIGEEKCH